MVHTKDSACDRPDAVLERVVKGTEEPDAAVKDFLRKAFPGSTSQYRELAFRYLVQSGSIPPTQDPNLLGLDLGGPWPPHVLAEAQRISESELLQLRLDREDLTALPAIAIDDPGTTEVDDALWLETVGGNLVLHVFISEPASAIELDGPLDRELRRRGTSIYLPQKTIPMMPECLGGRAFSLQAGQTRPALDFRFVFAQGWHLLRTEISPATVRVGWNLDYEQADELIAGHCPEGFAEVGAVLRQLAELAAELERSRVNAGAVIIKKDEFRVIVGEDGSIRVKPIRASSVSRRLVAEAMIASCTAAGLFFSRNRIPAIYRRQDAPDVDVGRHNRSGGAPHQVLQALSGLKRGETSVEPGRHHTLGAASYSQISSPLRRYGDLLMQRQLLSFMASGLPPYSAGDLQTVVYELDESAKQASRLESVSGRYWTLKCLEGMEGSRVFATVVRREGRQSLLRLDDFGLVTSLNLLKPLEEGEKLRLHISKVNAIADLLVVRQ